MVSGIHTDPFHGLRHHLIVIAIVRNMHEEDFEAQFLAWVNTQPAERTIREMLLQCKELVLNEQPLPWEIEDLPWEIEEKEEDNGEGRPTGDPG